MNLNLTATAITAAALVLAMAAITSCTPDGAMGLRSPVLPEELLDYRVEANPILNIQQDHDAGWDARAQLGRVLFYDRALSQNGAVSCGSCHHQGHGFAEPIALSKGLRQELTARNASHIVNAGFQSSYFWDGRATNLEEQVTMPLENHVEMGIRDLETLVNRLGQIDYYPDLFEQAYGSPYPTVEGLREGLATFLRSMVSQNSRMDHAATQSMASVSSGFWNPWGVIDQSLDLEGFSELERQGFELFHGRMLCGSCHSGPNFNGWGGGFSDIGLDMGVPGEVNAGGWGSTAMKVPSLRNVVLTAPYMHDGRFASLDDVLDHYSHGILDSPTLDLRLRNWENASVFIIDEPFIDFFPFPGGEEMEPVRMHMTPGERSALLAFMGTLTDLDFVKDVRYSNPFTSAQ